MQIQLILKQHQIMRGKITSLLERLEMLKKDSSVDSEVFEIDLKEMIHLVEAHSRCEEQILIPILVEMYSSASELTRYVEDDHKEIEKDLSKLMELKLNVKDDICKMRSILNRIIIHFEEEERGLIPLVEFFLKSKGLSIA